MCSKDGLKMMNESRNVVKEISETEKKRGTKQIVI